MHSPQVLNKALHRVQLPQASHFHIRQNVRCRSVGQATAAVLSKEQVTQIDTFLRDGKEQEVLDMVNQLKEQGVLKGYGGGRQVPKRQYTIEELRLNNIDAASLLSPEDKSLNKVRDNARAAAVAGLCAYAAYVGWDDAGKVLGAIFGLVFALVADQVANNGGGEALIVDSLGRIIVKNYGRRVALHEAGHFLVAYLMGLLPKDYTLSGLDAFKRYRALNVQAGCVFCDAAFQKQVASGQLKSSSLELYTCVALAGVITEALTYGQAEGGLGDVAQLDGLLRALGFTQAKADGEIRWAVLNVAALLRRHADTHAALASAMQSGASVGECIELIESKLKNMEDV